MRHDWWSDAQCLGIDTETFFSSENAAKKICRECPVRLDCLEYAFKMESIRAAETWGVWGGLTGGERRTLRRRLARRGQSVESMFINLRDTG